MTIKTILTTATVINVAKKIIKQKGEVSSLEIKDNLISKGYLVTRQMISKIMSENYDFYGLSFCFNGIHKIYQDSHQFKNSICSDDDLDESDLTFLI